MCIYILARKHFKIGGLYCNNFMIFSSHICWQGGAYTFSDGSSIVHADYFSGWDEQGLQKVLDECKNSGQAAMPDQWCENHLSFRDMPKILPKDVKDPDGSDARIVKMLRKIRTQNVVLVLKVIPT